MGGGTFWRDGLHSCRAAIYTADHTKVAAWKSIVAHIGLSRISKIQEPSRCGRDPDSPWNTRRGRVEIRTPQVNFNNMSLFEVRLLFKIDLMLVLRQFCMELNGLAVKLQAECKPETCTQVAILKTIMAMFCKRIQLQDEDNLKINSKLCRQSAL